MVVTDKTRTRIIKYFIEIKFLIGNRLSQIPVIFSLFVASSIIEIAGLGLIPAYIGVIASSTPYTNSKSIELLRKVGTHIGGDLILVLGLALIFIFLLKAVMSIYIAGRVDKFALDLSADLRVSLLRAYQRLPYSRYLERNSSEYISTMNLAEKFTGGSVLVLLKMGSDAILFLMVLPLLVFSNPLGFFVLISILLVTIAVYDYIFRPKLSLYGKLSNKYMASIYRYTQESIDGFKEVRVLGGEDYFVNSIELTARGYAEVNEKATLISSAPRYLFEFLIVGFVVLLVVITSFISKDINSVLPTLGLFGVACMRLMPAANQFLGGITKIRLTRNTVNLLYSDLVGAEKFEENQKDLESHGKEEFRSLAIENVFFRYGDGAPDILKGASLNVIKGEIIGIVGRSGSGKTTLIDIILGFLEPQDGVIKFNGHKINTTSSRVLTSKVGYLPQNSFLINDSLKKNVAFGIQDIDIDNQRVSDAIRAAQLEQWISNTPNGVETIIGDRGMRMSGGQRQRVSIARAFYFNRELLILDESTSALDDHTDNQIVEEIGLLKGKTSAIIISHRMSTLKHCDRVYGLIDGILVRQK